MLHFGQLSFILPSFCGDSGKTGGPSFCGQQKQHSLLPCRASAQGGEVREDGLKLLELYLSRLGSKQVLTQG